MTLFGFGRNVLAKPGRILTDLPAMASTKKVRTSKGTVVGFQPTLDAACVHFRGVPFAATTGGENKWRPPQPREAWGTQDLECFRFGAASQQNMKKSMGGLLGASVAEDVGVVGDDCLNLNITAPKDTSNGLLPVLVWVHGGANANGSNAQLGHVFPSDEFAEKGLVCVSINYRLAMHGFLHLPTQGVTNLALRDLIAGLSWVQEEIEAFGGDPSNMTVWGQSAGAVNVSTLMCSPVSRGLFHKAIVTSGAPSMWGSAQEYADTGMLDFVSALQKEVPALRLHESGEPLLADLLDVPPETIVKASANVSDSMGSTHGMAMLPASYAHFPDGDVLPAHCFNAIKEGSAAGVPLLVTSNSNEMSDFLRFIGGAMAGQAGRWAAEHFVRYALKPEQVLRYAAGRLKRDQLLDGDAKGVVDRLVKSIGSDAAVVDLLCTTAEREMAAAQAEHAPVFELELELTHAESPVIGSGHGLDFAILFQPANPGTDGPIFSAEQKAAACKGFFGREELGGDVQSLSEGLRDAIARFACNGNPEHLLNVPWPKAHGDQPGQMIGSTSPHYESWGADGISPKRKLLREAMHILPLQGQ